MQRTYELYAHRLGERVRFRPVTCHEHEVMRHAQDLIETEAVDEVEVREGGRVLFTVVK